MKIRAGFVSNSSSSSFIVALVHKPQSVEDLRKMLFGEKEYHHNFFSYGDEPSNIPTKDIAQTVFCKIKKKATIKDMIESISCGWFNDYCDCPGRYDIHEDLNFNATDKKDFDKLWDMEHKENNKRAKAIIDMFRKQHKNKYYVIMPFSDNNGESMEEHSGIFDEIAYIKTSYH